MVGQIDDERDFHIFYQFTKGASAEMKGQSCLSLKLPTNDQRKEAFGLQGPEAYAYTSRSGCLDVKSVNDISDFKETLVCPSSLLKDVFVG